MPNGLDVDAGLARVGRVYVGLMAYVRSVALAW
jgi:hypothetical protein